VLVLTQVSQVEGEGHTLAQGIDTDFPPAHPRRYVSVKLTVDEASAFVDLLKIVEARLTREGG
jgi:hypothetical protein